MTKKDWRKPEVREIQAGSAEAGKSPANDSSPGVNDGS